MQEETKMQDLFPAPHPFDMERGGAARCYRGEGSREPQGYGALKHLDRSFQPNTVVALALVVLLAIAFVMGAVNANLSSGTSHALWAADDAGDQRSDDMIQNAPTPSQAEED